MRRVIIESASTEVNSQIAETYYSGLGAVVASAKRVPTNHSWETEEFRASAVGTAYWTRSAKGSAATRHAQKTRFGFNGEVKSKVAVPPVLQQYYTDNVDNEYDVAGNTTHSTVQFSRQSESPDGERFYAATRSYYSADNRVAIAQRYHATEAGRSGAWEEFRYDALGRRVLSRTRRPSGPDGYVALCSSSCHEWIERTIWDGDNALYEARVNVTDSSSASAMDALSSSGLNWGLVGYVHIGGYDRPIFTMDGRVPSYNWRGLPESSVWTNGTRADCSLGGANCVAVAWPSANTIYLRPSPWGNPAGTPPQWVGTLLADGLGSTGMLYRRNRYYDPASGQFTQPDPIGIAGGANVYGFTSGDPVNFVDPFGLEIIAGPEARALLDQLKAQAARMAASRESLTRNSGLGLLQHIEQLEKSTKRFRIELNNACALGSLGVNSTATGTFHDRCGGGVGVHVSTDQFPGIDATVLLAHELGHLYYAMIEGHGLIGDQVKDDLDHPYMVAGIALENMARRFFKPWNCQARELDGHDKVVACK